MVPAKEKHFDQLSINYTAKVFPYISAADAHYNLLTLRQKDEESLTDYYNRFKSARDIVLNQLGPLSIIRLAEREPGYTTGRPGIPANPGDPKAVPPVEPIPAVPAIPSNVREYTKAWLTCLTSTELLLIQPMNKLSLFMHPRDL